jgi:hypothetical protein
MTCTATTSKPMRSIDVILGLLLLGTSPCLTAAAPDGAGLTVSKDAVSMTILDIGQGGYSVRGEFDVAAPQALAWAVLSDYGRIGDFVSSVRKSIVLESGPAYALVEQEGSGRVLIFSKRVHVVLHVTEENQRTIVFRDVSGKDFSAYDGQWDIRYECGVTHVSYLLNATLRSRKPGFLVRGSMQSSARELLEQVRAEMMRRATASRTAAGTVPAR